MHYSSQAPLLLKVGACALSVLSLTLGVALASAGTLLGEGGLGAGVMGMVGLSLLFGWRDTDFFIDADGHCRYSLGQESLVITESILLSNALRSLSSHFF